MFQLKSHLGVLLLMIIICNLAECCNEKPFNNSGCDNKYIPTGAAIIGFIIIEIIFWIIYFCFII